MSGPTASFGDVLRRLRNEASLSQEELAERAGLSRRGISDLERGAHRAPQFATVRLLADALNLDADGRAVLLAAARPETMAMVVAERDRPAPQASLPVPATRLIGRETEVAVLRDLLRQQQLRLITVTGPGGVGTILPACHRRPRQPGRSEYPRDRRLVGRRRGRLRRRRSRRRARAGRAKRRRRRPRAARRARHAVGVVPRPGRQRRRADRADRALVAQE